MIAINNVVKHFDKVPALSSVSLQINDGTAFGLLGSNGAGKSTLLRLISGVYRAESGEVLVDSEGVYENVSAKEKIFFISDETAQWNSYNMFDMERFYKTFYSQFSSELFFKLQKQLQLPPQRKLATFSKGMKRQAVMIAALACRPKFLLLDEAFDGLDPTMRLIVKQMLTDAMLDNNMTVVISSHNLREIDEFCDRAALLHQGKVVFDRELDSLKGHIHKIQTAFEHPPENPHSLTGGGITLLHSEISGSIYYLILRGDVAEVEQALKPYGPKLFDVLPLSLEEIFIYEMEVLGYDYTGKLD